MKNQNYSLLSLRIILGLLFIIPGFGKLMNPSMPIGMLTNLGFPAPAFLGWVLLLSELIFGLLVLIGFKTKYAIWPLVIILGVAAIFVTIPNMGSNPINLMFHLLGIISLIHLSVIGPGKYSIDKK